MNFPENLEKSHISTNNVNWEWIRRPSGVGGSGWCCPRVRGGHSRVLGAGNTFPVAVPSGRKPADTVARAGCGPTGDLEKGISRKFLGFPTFWSYDDHVEFLVYLRAGSAPPSPSRGEFGQSSVKKRANRFRSTRKAAQGVLRHVGKP